MDEQGTEPDAIAGLRRWGGVIVGLVVVGYVGAVVALGWKETAASLVGFQWGLTVPVLLLTLVNYGLRFVKWHWLLSRLGVKMGIATNFGVFMAGLAMTISPGKAGELLKPWLIRSITGTSMATVIPALVVERLTDAAAVVLLAALGISRWYAQGQAVVWAVLIGMVVAWVFFAVKPLNELVLVGLRAVGLTGVAARVEEILVAMRICVEPGPMLAMMVLSIVAWLAECVGCWLVFQGLGADLSLELATFLYAFATVFGAPSPGGVGMADVALAEGAVALVPSIPHSDALAGALLVRIATLWFGVVLGAFVLFRLQALVDRGRREGGEAQAAGR